MQNHAHTGDNIPVDAPLAGITVIELSSFVASPLGGMTLAQMGADVIRIDPVGGGPDRYRWPLAPSGESLYWAGLNQGKRSMAVDMRSPEGAALVADLICATGEGGGILLTNARARPGLSYAELSARRPDLIHVQLFGMRDGGTGVDYTVNASTGFGYVTGPADHDGPINHVLPAWDVVTGLYLATSILAADRRRTKTGAGQQMSVSLEDVALATAGNLGYLAEAQLCGTSRPRIGNQVYGDFGRDFTTADGQRVMVLVLTARHWNDLVSVTGMGPTIAELEKALDADFHANADRYRHRDLLTGLLTSWFEARNYAEVDTELSATSILWSRYRTFTELGTDADGRMEAHPLISTIDQPGIGSYRAPGLPVVLAGQQVEAKTAPQLGQHTHDVLAEVLALDNDTIDDLAHRGVIGALQHA